MTKTYLTKEEKITLAAMTIEEIASMQEACLLNMRKHSEKEIIEDHKRLVRLSRSLSKLSNFQLRIFCKHEFSSVNCNEGWDYISCSKCFTGSRVVCPDFLKSCYVNGVDAT